MKLRLVNTITLFFLCSTLLVAQDVDLDIESFEEHKPFELIFPKTGVSPNPWKTIHFDTKNSGYAIDTKGKAYKTEDNGVTWIEIPADGLKVYEPLELEDQVILKSYGKIGTTLKFIPFQKLKNGDYIGTVSIFSEYDQPNSHVIIQTNPEGDNWKLLNGICGTGLNSMLKDGSKILISDGAMSVHYSDDNGKSFSRTVMTDYTGNFRLLESTLKDFGNGLVSYFDQSKNFAVSTNFGKSWDSKLAIPVELAITDIRLSTPKTGLALNINGIMTFEISSKNEFVIKDTILYSPESPENNYRQFTSFTNFKNKEYILTTRKEVQVFDYESKKLSDILNGTPINYLGSKNGYLLATGETNQIFISTDGINFDKVPLDYRLHAYEATIFNGHLIATLFDHQQFNYHRILIYNIDSKKKRIEPVNFGFNHGSLVRELYNDYVLGKGGLLMKLNLE